MNCINHKIGEGNSQQLATPEDIETGGERERVS